MAEFATSSIYIAHEDVDTFVDGNMDYLNELPFSEEFGG